MQDNQTANRKEQIRAKHRKAFADEVEIIPAMKQNKNFDDSRPLRIAIYPPRISTGDTQQTTSFELQKSYYEELLKNNPEMPEAVKE